MLGGAQHTEGLTTDGDLLAVGLVDDTVDLLDVVGVGDDLVVGEDVLREQILAQCGRQEASCCVGHARAHKKAG